MSTLCFAGKLCWTSCVIIITQTLSYQPTATGSNIHCVATLASTFCSTFQKLLVSLWAYLAESHLICNVYIPLAKVWKEGTFVLNEKESHISGCQGKWLKTQRGAPVVDLRGRQLVARALTSNKHSKIGSDDTLWCSTGTHAGARQLMTGHLVPNTPAHVTTTEESSERAARVWGA